MSEPTPLKALTVAERPEDAMLLVSHLESSGVKEKAMQRSEERFRGFSRRLLQVQEQERRRIARKLHDEIGQTLTLARVRLQAVQRRPEASALAAPLDECSALIAALLDQVRAVSLDLRPPMLDDLGLVPALQWLNRQAQCSGLEVSFEAHDVPSPLDAALATACFRIVQEALTNVLRHASARSARIELRCRGRKLSLLVCDDGVGFDPAQVRERAERGGSFGLLAIEERAASAGGAFACESAPGKGTTIQVVFPTRSSEKSE